MVDQHKFEGMTGVDAGAAVAELYRRLGASHGTVATAESCTGGMISTWLTSPAGSSRFFLGGVCSYSNESKSALLGVDPGLIAANGAVSGPVVRAMAGGARARFGSTWAVSVSGIAGPDGGTPAKPVGTVWIGVAGPCGVDAREFKFPGDRGAVRQAAALAAIQFLLEKFQ